MDTNMGETEKLKIVSLNVRGLRAQNKRLKLFKWLKSNHYADIVYLQETHSTQLDEKLWTEQWGGEIFFCHGDSNARGVCVMINIRKSSLVHNVQLDDIGRSIMIDLTVSERRLTLVNIYAPNHDDPVFITNLIHLIENQINEDHVDKKGGALLHTNRNMKNLLKTYMEESDLIDIWRKHHPKDRHYTYHCKIRNEYIFSRLDFFLVSFGISNLVESSSIGPSILTDHSLIKLTLQIDADRRGPGFWKCNCSLLHDIDYVNKVKTTIREIVDIENEQNPGLLWEVVKLGIRTETIRYCIQKKRSKNNLMSALERRLKTVQNRFEQTPTDEDKQDIELIKLDISDILQEQINGCIMRTKINWQEYGEKTSKFFLSLEKK